MRSYKMEHNVNGTTYYFEVKFVGDHITPVYNVEIYFPTKIFLFFKSKEVIFKKSFHRDYIYNFQSICMKTFDEYIKATGFYND